MPPPLSPLERRWQDAHAVATAAARALAASLAASPHDGSSAAVDAAARLPPGTLDAAALAAAIGRRRHAAASAAVPEEQLRSQLDELDAVLDEMHAAVEAARAAAQRLPLADAADRGPHGLSLSPADRCAALAAPLRAYEAELALKRAICNALCSRKQPRLSAEEAHALLLAWESQPLLEPVEAMRQGYAAQVALEAVL
jgi:hypothetical protein